MELELKAIRKERSQHAAEIVTGRNCTGWRDGI